MTLENLKSLSFAKKTASQVFTFYCVFLLALFAFAFLSKCLLYYLILCLAYAVLPVCVVNFRRAQLALRHAELTDEENDNLKKLEKLRKAQGRWYKPYTRVATLFFVVFPALSIFGLLQLKKSSAISFTGGLLSLIALSGILSFVALVARIYFTQAGKYLNTRTFKSICGGINLAALCLCLSTLALCAEYLKIPKALYYCCVIVAVLNLLIVAETLLKVFFSFFRPRVKGSTARDAFDLYLFELLLTPSAALSTTSDLFNHQLGFEATKSKFFKLTAALTVPVLFASIILLWALSSVVIIGASQQALVIRFGNVTKTILNPGIHLKAPWPIDKVRIFDVWKIRRVRVGSHRPQKEDGEIYVKDTPILWTNSHGLVTDELLIVAPPADLMKKIKTANTSQQNDQKAPSVSLAGADVTVEYRINNLKKYIESCAVPEKYFKEIAMAASSRALFRYDIDSLFCHGRIELPAVLKKEIQQAIDRINLGIKVLNVGIGGVHPPQSVAGVFQETVAALQEKETTIQWAKQYAISNMTETTGSMKKSEDLIRAITREEKKSGINRTRNLLHNASGHVAVTLAEAKAYRWERENLERGKAERFTKERLLYLAAPKTYLNDCYMSVLESGLGESTKYVLVGQRKNLVLRFDFKELVYPAEEEDMD